MMQTLEVPLMAEPVVLWADTSAAARDMDGVDRAVTVAWWLADGCRMTTVQVAARLGVHRATAYRMMLRISRVLPLALDTCGRWYRTDQLPWRA
jgi:hypothetical protein